MERRRLGGGTAQAGPKLRQRGSMPTRTTPSTPPKVPYLSRKGAIEEHMGDRLLSITTQNIIRGALKSIFTKIIPHQTVVVRHYSHEKIALGPRNFIPNFLPPRDLNIPK